MIEKIQELLKILEMDYLAALKEESEARQYDADIDERTAAADRVYYIEQVLKALTELEAFETDGKQNKH